MHDMGPSPAAAPPGFETALQDFQNPSATSGSPAEPDEAVCGLQRLSADLKALMRHGKAVTDASFSQQVPFSYASVLQACATAKTPCSLLQIGELQTPAQLPGSESSCCACRRRSEAQLFQTAVQAWASRQGQAHMSLTLQQEGARTWPLPLYTRT